MLWEISFLSDWAIKIGLQPRLQGTGDGVIFSPTDESTALFSIRVTEDSDYCAIVKINQNNERAISLLEHLQELYDINVPDNLKNWAQLELSQCKESLLNEISEWVGESIVTPDSPVPHSIETTEHQVNGQDVTYASSSNNKTEIVTDEKSSLNKWLFSFLAARGMACADGRALYAYKATEAEFEKIKKQLSLVAVFRGHVIFKKDRKFSALFVLFAAEWWRREYRGGTWTWLSIYEAIGLDKKSTDELLKSPQSLLYPSLEDGFHYWKRDIYSLGHGRRFIGSIAAEGGLPLNLLNDPNTGLKRFFKHLLERYLPLRSQGISASQTASELYSDLPTSFQREQVYRVAGEIVETTLELRSQFELAGHDEPVEYLEKVCPEWRERFPLSLDNEPAKALLRALVVDAANSSDTSEPLLLCRFLTLDFQNQYKLQSTIEFSRKVSNASLKLLFGDIDFSHTQIEVWLVRPFKSRLALLSKIDNDHYRVKSSGACWKGRDAYAETAVALFSYDIALTDEVPLEDSLLEEDLPWVFVEKNNHLRYLGQGGMSLSSDEVTLLLPNDVTLSCDDSEPELLGNVVGIERAVFQGSGLIKVQSNEGVYSIRTRQPKLEISNYKLTGKQCYKKANVRQIYFGAPKLRVIDASGVFTTLPTTDIQWRHAGDNGDWKPWSNLMRGIVDIKAMSFNEILYRSRIAVLPDDAHFDITAGNDNKTGEILITNLPDVRCVTPADYLDFKVVNDENGNKIISLTRTDDSYSFFPLHLQWLDSPKSLKLEMPIPVSGAQFRDVSGAWINDQSFVSVSDLAGIHAVGFSYSGDRNEKYEIDITVKARDIRGADMKAISKRIPLIRIGEVAELPLLQLREQFLQLMSLSEDLDCRLELTLIGKTVYKRLQVARYTHQLELDDQVIRLASAEFQGNVEQGIVDNLCLEAHSLLNPVERGYPLEHCLTQGVSTGEWCRLFNLNPGPWLVMSGKDQETFVRPTIVAQGEYVPMDDGRLRDAIAIADERERKQQINECITKMSMDYGHKDWKFVFETLETFQHLPATALDLWDCFARNPGAMAMLLIASDESNYQKVIDLSGELPFIWELVQLNSWMIAMQSLKEFITESAPVGMTEILVKHSVSEKQKFMLEADEVLESVLYAFKNIVQSRNYNDEVDSEELKGLVDKIYLSAASLMSRHSVDSEWAVLHGNLFNYIHDNSPELVQKLFIEHSSSMLGVLHAPIAMAIKSTFLQQSFPTKLSNTDLYQIQMIRSFDREWYKEAYSLTVQYMYALGLTDTKKNNEDPE